MKFHPLAEIFPPLPDPELQELANDILEHGLREPITTFKGKILDGKNRFRACQKAGVKPQFKEFKGDAKALVRSLNIHRRHLTESQRAMLAAELMKGQICPGLNEAAKAVSVSSRSVKSANRVNRLGSSKLKNAVLKNEMAVSVAAKVATLPKSEQRAAVKNAHQIAELEEKLDRLPRGGLGPEATRAKIQKELKELRGEDAVTPKQNGDGGEKKESRWPIAPSLTLARVLDAYDAEIKENLKNYASLKEMAVRVRVVLSEL